MNSFRCVYFLKPEFKAYHQIYDSVRVLIENQQIEDPLFYIHVSHKLAFNGGGQLFTILKLKSHSTNVHNRVSSELSIKEWQDTLHRIISSIHTKYQIHIRSMKYSFTPQDSLL